MMSRLLQELKHQGPLRSEKVDLSHVLYSYLEQVSSSMNVGKLTDQKLLLDFVFQCLSLAYWRERQKEFFSQIRMLLELMKESIGLDEEFCQKLYNIQICPIHSQNTLYEVICRQVRESLRSDEKLSILPNGKKNLIRLILSSDGVLCVRPYLSYGVIYNGQILPLSDGTHLKYSPEMDLLTDHLHILRKNQSDYYLIKKIKGVFSITDVSGVTFVPNSFDQLKRLENHTQIYYYLKRLEQFFIDRSTDPYYRDIVYLLETQIQNLSRDPCCVSESIKVYEKVWDIFDKVFQDDKLLALLLEQLGDRIDRVRTSNDVKCTKKNKIKSSLGPEWGM